MTMEWQPIETAPADKRVLAGRWRLGSDGKLIWQQYDIVANNSYLWGMVKKLTYDGAQYSHWKKLPPPPLADAVEGV